MNSEYSDDRELRVRRAMGRVLAADVDAYAVIYEVCDGSLRSFIGSRYGRLGKDFVDEVAIRTHEYVLTRLDKYKSDKDASFQTWLNLRSLNVAGKVLVERYGLRRVAAKDGRRRRVAVSESFDEETHAQRARPVPGPAEEREARLRSRLLWQEYEALAREGRLSIALHDIAGRTLADTARELGEPLIRVRRLLERNHNSLRKRLKRLDVRPVEPEPHHGRVWTEPDDTGYDNDWTATPMACLPDDPDTLVGAAARREEEDREQP